MTKDNEQKILDQVDAGRRDVIKKFITGAAFVAPAVASFSMDGLTVNSAMAAIVSNSTTS